jgi:membrane protease YdiL (CAAX protease family)
LDTTSQSNKHTVRNLAIFAFLVIALGWLGRWLDSLMGSTSSEGLGITIWLIAPFGVSFLLRAFAGDGWKDLGIRPAIKGNVLWYAVSILVYPVCATFILVIGLALGAVSFPDFSLMVFVQAVAMIIVQQAIKNIFEEFAFRGYLAPKMYKLGLNVFVAHVVVGLIWGVWHLPYLRAITPYTVESLATLIPRFLVAAVAASIVYGEIRMQTDSVWPAWLMHTVGATFVGALMLHDLIRISSGMEYLFTPVFEGGLAIVLFTLIGVGIHLLRRKRTTAART